MRYGHRVTDSRATTLGRIAAAGWLLAALLVVRIVTNGTFTELAVNPSSTRTLLAIGGLALATMAVALAVVLVMRPSARAFTASWIGALGLASYGIVQLALRHESAAVVMALGAAIGVVSIVGWRGLGVTDRP
jgi:hypothetical protein